MSESVLGNFFDRYSKYLIVLIAVVIIIGLFIMIIKFIRYEIANELNKSVSNKSISKIELYKEGVLVESIDAINGEVKLISHLPYGEYVIKEYY